MTERPTTREVRIGHLGGTGPAARFRVESRDGEVEEVTGFTALARRLTDELADAHTEAYVLTCQYVPRTVMQALAVRRAPPAATTLTPRPVRAEVVEAEIVTPAPRSPQHVSVPPAAAPADAADEGSYTEFFTGLGNLWQMFKDSGNRDR
jgi:hypothetical protein